MTGFHLNLLEFDACWALVNHHDTPTVLDIPAHGATTDERARLLAGAHASARARGLLDAGHLNPDLEAALSVLARPRRHLDARLRLRDGPATRAMAAAHGRLAALAARGPDTVSIRLVNADRLAEEIVGLLPPHPSGPRRTITVDADVIDRAWPGAGDDPALLETLLADEGVPRREGRVIAFVMANLVRSAQFGATYRPTDDGRTARAPHAVSVYDTPHARYQFTKLVIRGTWTYVLSPADQVLAAVRALLDDLVDRHSPVSDDEYFANQNWTI